MLTYICHDFLWRTLMIKITPTVIIFAFLLNFTAHATDDKKSLINWKPWSAEVFTQAKKEKKLVIMDLEAVWCHWCHVMDAKTYRNPAVADLINKNFVAVRVDQDKQPDISNRYEDYGWPATIIFDANGTEIIKRRGYLGPKFMGYFLEAVIAEPTPDAHDNVQRTITPSKDAFLSKEQKELLNTRYEFIYDQKHKGWGRRQKFVHSDSIEYAIVRGSEGSKKHERMAKDTLDASRALIDPEWGGVYQYSDEVDWQSPHFEKVMKIQTDSLRLYAMAYKQWGRKADLESALLIYAFLDDMLKSTEGVFYTSQDADLNDKVDGHAFFPLKDQARRKLGVPTIDKHIYARENGWIISALTALYTATDDKKYLDEASKIATWMIKNRSTEAGGFIHDKEEKEVNFLGDTLAMGQAFLDLYTQTKDIKWLDHASATVTILDKKFKDDKGGFSTLTSSAENLLITPVKHTNSQIMIARFGSGLQRVTQKKEHEALAKHAMRYLSSTDLTEQRRLLAGILLANREVNNSK